MPNCPFCDCYVSAGAKFCPSCGGKISADVPAPQPAAPETPNVWYAQPETPPPPPPPEPMRYYDPGPGVREVILKALDLLSNRPVRLWGISLLYSLLSGLAFSFCVLPIIYFPVVVALGVGMEALYLEAIHGSEPEPRQLFRGFAKGSFLRYVCGMGWSALWIIIWSLIPIVGPFIAIAKGYSYRFVPYIMLSDPEVDAFDALKRSIEMTRGFRLRMFLSELVIYLLVFLVCLVLGLLGAIPFIGVLFIIVDVLFVIIVIAFAPLLLGLMRATFYDEIEKML